VQGENHFAHAEGHGLDTHFHENEDALGYESFGCVYTEISFDRGTLEDFFQELNASQSKMGEIVRAKGVFQIGTRYILMELASGEFSSQPISRSAESKISVIGRGLDRETIRTALDRCVQKKESPNS
jgi:G3E family GTPase